MEFSQGLGSNPAFAICGYVRRQCCRVVTTARIAKAPSGDDSGSASASLKLSLAKFSPNKRLSLRVESAEPLSAVSAPFLLAPSKHRRLSRSGTNPAVSHSPASTDVKKAFLNRTMLGISLLALLALTGCGTPPAKDFGGRWKPVNRFQATPTAIPLDQQYVYFAAPMDGTLKNMLTRWAKDSGLTLSYQLPTDYTLITPVTQVRTLDIHVAAEQLSSIYAAEGVSVVVTDRQIQVVLASPSPPAAAATPSGAAATSNAAPDASKPAASASSK